MEDRAGPRCKIGAAGFVVPFMFVYEPALLMIGDWPTIVWRFVVSCIGIGLLAAGLHGYLLRPMPIGSGALPSSARSCWSCLTFWADLARLGRHWRHDACAYSFLDIA